MYKPKLMRVALGSFAAVCLSAAGTAAAEVNTADFIAACTSDISVTEDPGFEDGKATPKAYCECVAGEFANAQLSQADVDMLTKMHKEEITDEDVENFPTLEDLMNANEDIEDGCREKLGLPVGFTDIEEEEIDEEEMVPEDEDVSPPE
ncbi:MAG TPA: hypothetical protein VLB11_00930 [Methyloceanibacter sp.]|nr:hypothetical protein [Methyloceanibacter sp.]